MASDVMVWSDLGPTLLLARRGGYPLGGGMYPLIRRMLSMEERVHSDDSSRSSRPFLLGDSLGALHAY